MVQPTIRKNFKDTAFWQPDVVTGADGRATVKVDLPDNLTTWRATARGVTCGHQSRRDKIQSGRAQRRDHAAGDAALHHAGRHRHAFRNRSQLSGEDKSTQISLDVGGAQLLNSGNKLSLSPSKASIASIGRSRRRMSARSSFWPKR